MLTFSETRQNVHIRQHILNSEVTPNGAISLLCVDGTLNRVGPGALSLTEEDTLAQSVLGPPLVHVLVFALALK